MGSCETVPLDGLLDGSAEGLSESVGDGVSDSDVDVEFRIDLLSEADRLSDGRLGVSTGVRYVSDGDRDSFSEKVGESELLELGVIDCEARVRLIANVSVTICVTVGVSDCFSVRVTRWLSVRDSVVVSVPVCRAGERLTDGEKLSSVLHDADCDDSSLTVPVTECV